MFLFAEMSMTFIFGPFPIKNVLGEIILKGITSQFQVNPVALSFGKDWPHLALKVPLVSDGGQDLHS